VKQNPNWLGPSTAETPPITLGLPAGIRLLTGIRSDLQHLDPERLSDRLIIRNWWESGAYRDYLHIEWPLTVSDIDALHSRPEDDPLADGGHGLSIAFKGSWPSVLDLIPAFATHRRVFSIGPEAVTDGLPVPLLFIWRDRNDLQSFHDLTEPSGRLGFLKWWFLYGHLEYVRFRWTLSPTWMELIYPVQGSTHPLPAFLAQIISARIDLRGLFQLETEAGWLAAIQWWAQNGATEYGVPSWTLSWNSPLKRLLSERATAFNASSVPEAQRPALPLPYLPFMVRQMRPDLETAFNTQTRAGCEQLLAWWKANGLAEYKDLAGLMEDPDAETPGLNIVGYAQSVIGIAEDVRMAAKAAELTDTPFCVIDVPMPGPARSDHSLDAHLVEAPVHPVSLYCLPPPEMFRLGMESQRRILESGTYNIGGWHWELPSWPESLRSVTDSVDEIWVYTEFVRQAFEPLTSKPVIKMPLAVELPKHGGRNRAALGLPKEPFLFLLMFDGNSWLTRKNPIAAVRAFRKAFAGNRDVGLVIKAISLNRDFEGWREVEAEIGGDTRVSVIDKTLDRPSLTQLMASCDAYVSLHRSEGFGRIIAEAMLLGIPTVTTNFSGNTEFCTAQTSYLVNGPLISLKKGEYLFAEGQHWCDPDVDEAARQMQHLFEDRSHTAHMVAAARQNIQTNFSARTAGLAYQARLCELRAKGTI